MERSDPAVRRSGNRHGFTLIEIAVVLAIIGVVLVLVVPRLPSTENEDLKISARTLAATLRYVQDRAATTGKSYVLIADPGGDDIAIQERSVDGAEKEPDDPLLRKRALRENIRVADVATPRLGRLNQDRVRLEVGVDGLRDFVTIHLRSPEGAFWTVMAFPAGGKVKVYEGYQEDAL